MWNGVLKMLFDLVRDVFDPVFLYLEYKINYLVDRTPDKFGKQRGLETWFRQEIVVPTLEKRGCQVNANDRGVDLHIRHANSELSLELKAANDFRINYVVGVEKDGWITKYIEQDPLHRFAGCLFLGCESYEAISERLTELDQTLKNRERMRGHNITLAQHEKLATRDGRYYWSLGLLVTAYGRKLSAGNED
jgi:hypothetical protein